MNVNIPNSTSQVDGMKEAVEEGAQRGCWKGHESGRGTGGGGLLQLVSKPRVQGAIAGHVQNSRL